VNLRKKINGLNKFISEEVNEKSLVTEGRKLLDTLREDWRSNRTSFSEDDVMCLQKIARLLDEVENFVYEQKDFDLISSKEEVDEVIVRLHDMLETTSELKIMTRIKKEIRELLERKTVLPSRGQTKKDKQLLRALSVLRSNSYECNKCGANMVLRDGPNLPFWGCSTFPACWGKKHLTKDELGMLPD